MRIMEIPAFRDHKEISDLDNFYKFRLSQDVVLWPEQAIPLLGYMCWPNDPKRRDQLMRTVKLAGRVSTDSDPSPPNPASVVACRRRFPFVLRLGRRKSSGAAWRAEYRKGDHIGSDAVLERGAKRATRSRDEAWVTLP